MTATSPTDMPLRHWRDQDALARRNEWKPACGAAGPLPLYIVRVAFRVTCPTCLPIAQRDESAQQQTTPPHE